jgi:hypothetical protein
MFNGPITQEMSPNAPPALLFPSFAECSPLGIRFPVANFDDQASVDLTVKVYFGDEYYIPPPVGNWNGWTITDSQDDSTDPLGIHGTITCEITITVPPSFGLDALGNPIGDDSLIPILEMGVETQATFGSASKPKIEVVYSGGFGEIDYLGAFDNENAEIIIPDGTFSSQITNPLYSNYIRAQGCSPVINSVPGLFGLPTTIRIEGRFFIDEPICLIPTGYSGSGPTKKSIILDPGASITVLGGNSLTIKEALIAGCDQLAQGLIVESGATLTMTGTKIYDCRHAIQAKGNATIACKDNCFENNYIGFQAPSGTVKFSLPFSGNTFTSNTLKASFPGMTETFASLGYAGIEVNEFADFNTWDGNKFNSLANGIIATRSSANLDNLEMSNIGAPEEGIYPYNGYGVYASGKSSNFVNLSKNNGSVANPTNVGSRFTNVRFPVHFKSIGGVVEKCTMGQGSVGITWQSSALRDKVILNNTISNHATGISLLDCEPTPFQKNEFGLVKNNSTTEVVRGIQSIENLASPSEFGWKFESNPLNVKQNFFRPAIGILYSLGQNGWLDANTIVSDNPSRKNGANIKLTKTGKAVATDNNLSGQKHAEYAGIELVSNSNATLECNIHDGHATGVRVLFENGGSQIKGSSDLQNHNIGIQYGSNTIKTAATGPQFHAGNIFANSKLLIGAKHEDPAGADTDKYIVDLPESDSHLGQNVDRSLMPTEQEPDNWFKDIPNSTHTFWCDPLVTFNGSEPCENNWNVKIAQGEWIPTLYPESQRWIAEYRVLVDLDQTPITNGCEPLFAQFLTNEQGSVKEQLAHIRVLRNDLFALSDAQSLQLRIFTDQMYEKSHAMAQTEKLIQSGNTQLETTYAMHKQGYISAIQELETYAELISQERNQKANLILDLNSAVSDADVIEANHKVVNEIAVWLILEGRNLNSSEVETLLNIAQQCPLTGGDAVFEARGLLNSRFEFEDEAACIPSENQDRGVKLDMGKSVIVPNPAISEIQILGHAGKHYQITDAYGRVKQQGILSNEVIFLNQLASGVYTITLWDNSTDPVTLKFIVLQD